MPGNSQIPPVRQRLLEAANSRFRAAGFHATTAASIAADAGVSERTFFRHFPTKADVLVANWEAYGDQLRATMHADEDAEPFDVVRAGLAVFTMQVQREFLAGAVGVVVLYQDHRAFAAIIQNLLGVESDIATEIARRVHRSENDFDVRVTANAAMGVMRAGIRGFVFDPGGPSMVALVEEGMTRLRPLFAALVPPDLAAPPRPGSDAR